ncbi:uncharacterized protein LOC103728737 [Nannospalax galili]|uniref:uncharacterized protein LOC103728737 n=1 Tax=Nannospalax galili TaxID=1026970 RepID=UPI000819B9EB|nr:uncharacterized protein LOC103728737 [Nannospalax galili]
MHLSLSQPHFRTLLLLVSSLLVWDNVTSVPTSPISDDCCQVSFKDLFERAVKVSQYIQKEAASVFTEFKNKFGQEWEHNHRHLQHCHTSTLDTPETKKQTEDMHPEILMKLVQIVLQAWNTPLQHLVTEISAMKEISTSILSKTKEIEQKHKVLLEGVEWIFSKFQTGYTDNNQRKVPTWYQLESLKSSNKDTRLFTMYNTFYCLRRDSNKVATYINFLNWRIVQSTTEKPASTGTHTNSIKHGEQHGEKEMGSGPALLWELLAMDGCWMRERTLFLMLVSSLLLWENVASAVAKSNSGKPPLLMDTFKQAIKLSKEMNQRIRVVSDNFNQFYTQGRGFERRNATSCHTDPLGIPENKDQASQIQLQTVFCVFCNVISIWYSCSSHYARYVSQKPEVLLKGLQSLLSAWIEPLSHLWSLMLNKLGYTPPMLTRVMEVKEKNAKILESIRKILDQVNIGTGGNEGYLPWSGLASLQAANRDTRYFAFYNLFRCLKRDSSHVELYLRYLQCKSVQGSGC